MLPWHKFPFYLTIAHFGTSIILALTISRAMLLFKQPIRILLLALPVVVFLSLKLHNY